MVLLPSPRRTLGQKPSCALDEEQRGYVNKYLGAITGMVGIVIGMFTSFKLCKALSSGKI